MTRQDYGGASRRSERVVSAGMRIPYVDALALLFFGLAALLLRSPTLLRSVIDWDESLYFLMAESWRAGNLPYTTLFDNKPIGIYAIFALFQCLFGDDIASMRLASMVAVMATAFFVYKITDRIVPAETEARYAFAGFAGILYILCSVLNGGMASNTELFFSPFVCCALYMALKRRPATRRPTVSSFLIGMVAGSACLVKPVAVFEAGAIVFALVHGGAVGQDFTAGGGHAVGNGVMYRAWRLTATSVRLGAPFVLGIFFPVVLVVLLYAAARQLPLLIETNVWANLRRIADPFNAHRAARTLAEQALCAPLYFGALLLFRDALYDVFFRNRSSTGWRPNAMRWLLVTWIAGAFTGVVVGKSFFPHFLLQPLPALCVATAWVLAQRLTGRRQHPAIHGGDGAAPIRLVLVFVVLGLASGAAAIAEGTLMPVSYHREDAGIGWLKDTPAQIAAAIAPELARSPEEILYVLDYEPIIYSLAHAAPPTRYAFPPFLIDRHDAELPGVDADQEVERILARCPMFIVRTRDIQGPMDPLRRNDDVYRRVNREMTDRYVPVKQFPEATLYRRVSC